MTKVMTHSTPAVATWRLWIAPLVWAAHFLAIYGFTALACARTDDAGWFGVGAVAWFIGAATLVAVTVLLATIAVAVRDIRRAGSLPEPSRFVPWLTAAMATLVLVAVMWEALPILLIPACG